MRKFIVGGFGPRSCPEGFDHGMGLIGGVLIALALVARPANAQTLTTLLSFSGTNGCNPQESSLTLLGSTLYGMTWGGGTNERGNIFSIKTDGSGFQNVFSFNGTNGQLPQGSLTLSGSTFYGMTYGDFALPFNGNLFSIKTDGSGFQDLYSFTSLYNGSSNTPGNVTVVGSTLYGMTHYGINNSLGNIFSIKTDGSEFNDLLEFSGADGCFPTGSLTASGSTLYGMTPSGISNGNFSGNIFSIRTDGSGFHNILSFSGTNGRTPRGSLTLSGSTLYAVTWGGGTNDDGTVFRINIDGTGFKTLLSFSGSDGQNPSGDLTLVGSTLYGMTELGGAYGVGTIFSINTDGSGFDDLVDFNNSNGSGPLGSLTVSPDGSTLYGMTTWGGATGNGNPYTGDGTIFALTLPTQSPEPSTFALLAAGAIGLLSYGLRRRLARRTANPSTFDQQDAQTVLSFRSHSSQAQTARRAA